jgi:hypothetical protein
MKDSGSPHLSRSVGRVQPVLGQSEVCCDSRPCSQEGWWQRFGEAQLAIFGYREEIYVSGRTPDEAEGGQRGTTDDDDLNTAVERLQLIGQRAEQQADGLVSDLHVSECNRLGC